MKVFSISLVCFCLASFCQAQPNGATREQADSVWKLYLAADRDADKLEFLCYVTRALINHKPLYADSLADIGLQLARKTNDKTKEVEFLGHKAFIAFATYDVVNSIELSYQGIALAKDDATEQIKEFHLRIASAFEMLEDFENALVEVNKAEHLPQFYTLPPENQWSVYAVKGSIFNSMNQLDSAEVYLLKSLSKAYQTPWAEEYIVLNVLATLMLKKGNPDSAMKLINECINSSKYNPASDLPMNYLTKASAYDQLNKTDSVIHYANLALAGEANWKKTGVLRDAHALLAKSYQRSNPARAYEHLKRSVLFADSLSNMQKIKRVQTLLYNQEKTIRETKQREQEFRNQVKFYSLIAGVLVFAGFGWMMWKRSAYRRKQNLALETANKDLRDTQAQLIQSEKMASLGELTAGIAHEIQNPLNFMNNFSDINKDLLLELKEEIEKGNLDEVKILADDLIINEKKINHHGKRADSIVKGMLQHSRISKGEKELTDINALVDEYLRLAFHGMRARDKTFNAALKTDFDPAAGNINIVSQDIGRVLLNLYNNAFQAVADRAKNNPGHNSEIVVNTHRNKGQVTITVKDNGDGIPEKIISKIFQPFFTTKPTGQGTGLGLSLAYDIIKSHGGEITVRNRTEGGAEFTIIIPQNS